MTVLSDKVEASCSTAWRTVQRETSALRVVCDGNSLTAGQASPYPTQLAALMPSWVIVNKGVGAQDTQDMIADAASDIYPSAATQGKRNILIPWEMRNDMFNNSVTPQQAVDNMKAYCLGARARGFSLVLVPNCIKGEFGTGTWTEQNWPILNDLFAEQVHTFADGQIDLASKPEFQDITNTDYYTDLTHLTPTAYGIVAAAVRDGIVARL